MAIIVSLLAGDFARRVGAERWRGLLTFFARFDLRVLLSQRGAYGLWEYAAHPEVSRWVTFDLLRSLSRPGEQEGWLSQEPRTPFTAYPRQRKRFYHPIFIR